MNFELTGVIYEIYDTVQKTEKFRTREFVLEVEKQIKERTITDYVKFQSTGDKCDLLNRYSKGDMATVHFNIRGNKWEKDGKVSYFTNLDAWRIEGSQQTNDTPAEYKTTQPMQPNNDGDYNDQLPF